MCTIARSFQPSSALRLLKRYAASRRCYSLATKTNENNMPANSVESEPPRVMSTELSWGYAAHNGPHTWARYHNAAAGLNQSPVNIDLHRVVRDPALERNALRLQQTTCSKGVLINYGRGFRVEFDSDARLTGGPVTANYHFEQFHMHWGPSRHYGSEHAIDGRSYAAELHMVFIDRRRCPTFNDALRRDDRDSLCVLGVFINEGADNPVMEPIIQRLSNIAYRDQRAPLPERVLLKDFLPKNSRDYFTYPGSLTTPPCSEVVQWIVFRDQITMSERQLNQCRAIYETSEGAKDHSQCDINCRTCCPVGSRVIRSSFPVKY